MDQSLVTGKVEKVDFFKYTIMGGCVGENFCIELIQGVVSESFQSHLRVILDLSQFPLRVVSESSQDLSNRI